MARNSAVSVFFIGDIQKEKNYDGTGDASVHVGNATLVFYLRFLSLGIVQTSLASALA